MFYHGTCHVAYHDTAWKNDCCNLNISSKVASYKVVTAKQNGVEVCQMFNQKNVVVFFMKCSVLSTSYQYKICEVMTYMTTVANATKTARRTTMVTLQSPILAPDPKPTGNDQRCTPQANVITHCVVAWKYNHGGYSVDRSVRYGPRSMADAQGAKNRHVYFSIKRLSTRFVKNT